MIPAGDWELWDHDRALGRKVWARFDGRRWHTRTEYDAEALVDANARERNAMAGQRWGEWRKVASIPANIAYSAMGIAHDNRDPAYVRRWLNDGDNAAFRTFGGRV